MLFALLVHSAAFACGFHNLFHSPTAYSTGLWVCNVTGGRMYWNGVCVVGHCSMHKSHLAQSFVRVVVLNARRAVILYGHTGVATTITSLASFPDWDAILQKELYASLSYKLSTSNVGSAG